jgi:predicted DNA-binding protein with PD1-like motif
MEASAQSSSVNQNMFVFRLKPHEDLKKSIQQFASANKIKAGAIVTCVGSLEQYNLRFANQQNGSKASGHFEILSLTGTFSETSMHLHLSLGDSTGKTVGGHLLDENLVYTTAEIVIVEITDLEFQREVDSTYGYPELVIRKKEKKKP